jgi:cytoskeletal protein CcmA (bactofilin family)
MHISNLGLHIRQRTLNEAEQEVVNETRPETDVLPAQGNSGTKDFSAVSSKSNPTSITNFLSRDVEIKGSIVLTEELFIDGKLEGEIKSAGTLTVGENAEIFGGIRANSAKIFGKITGDITADEYCELKAQSVLEGDLKASRLVMEDGASFVGNSRIIPSRIVVELPQTNNSIESKDIDQSANV